MPMKRILFEPQFYIVTQGTQGVKVIGPLNPIYVNPLLTNGFAHHYHFGEPTFILRGIRNDFVFFIHFSMKFL